MRILIDPSISPTGIGIGQGEKGELESSFGTWIWAISKCCRRAIFYGSPDIGTDNAWWICSGCKTNCAYANTSWASGIPVPTFEYGSDAVIADIEELVEKWTELDTDCFEVRLTWS